MNSVTELQPAAAFKNANLSLVFSGLVVINNNNNKLKKKKTKKQYTQISIS